VPLRGGADGSTAVGDEACATRVPDDAVCAEAPDAGSKKMPARATHTAAVLIRVISPPNMLWHWCSGSSIRLPWQLALLRNRATSALYRLED